MYSKSRDNEGEESVGTDMRLEGHWLGSLYIVLKAQWYFG